MADSFAAASLDILFTSKVERMRSSTAWLRSSSRLETRLGRTPRLYAVCRDEASRVWFCRWVVRGAGESSRPGKYQSRQPTQHHILHLGRNRILRLFNEFLVCSHDFDGSKGDGVSTVVSIFGLLDVVDQIICRCQTRINFQCPTHLVLQCSTQPWQ